MRHNSTGGEFVQSVSIFTPRTLLSRFGPRKPGQFASVSFKLPRFVKTSSDWLSNFSSFVFAQRHSNIALAFPVIPSDRRRVQNPHAKTMVSIIVKRFNIFDMFRLTAAQITNDMLKMGTAYIKYIKPDMPVFIESCVNRLKMTKATNITATANKRSTKPARLKNTHQIRMRKLQASPPKTLTTIAVPPVVS